MRIIYPIIELLAIKLYEHDNSLGWYPRNMGECTSWMKLPESERRRYRNLASGAADLPDNEEKTPEPKI